MANDIADIGFRADTSDLVDAKKKLDALSPATGKAGNAINKLAQLFGVSNQNANKFTQAVMGASAANDNFTKSITASTAAASAFRIVLAGLGAVFGAVVAAMSLGAYVKLADMWSDLSSIVGVSVGNMEQAPLVMQRLADVADRTYSSLQNTVEGFVGVNVALRELGYTTNQSLDFVEALNNALVVSGAKGQRAESVMNALSKAMSLGKLSGMNLNTVIQQGGKVAQLLADKFKTTTGGLLAFGARGEITGKVINEVLVGNLEKLRDLADAMPATVGDAMGRIGNAVLQTVGKFDQLTGISAKLSEYLVDLSKGIKWVGNNLDVVAQGALKAAVPLAILFGPAILAGAASLVAAIISLNFAIAVGLVQAIAAATVAMTAFILSNPFTAIVQGVFILITAVYLYRDVFRNVFGVDLTSIVKESINMVINTLFGMAEVIITTFKSIPTIVGAAIIGAVNAVLGAIEVLMKAGAAVMNTFIEGANKAREYLGYEKWNLVDPSVARFENQYFDNMGKEFDGLQDRLDNIAKTDWVGAVTGGVAKLTDKLTIAAKDASGLNDAVAALGSGDAAGSKKGKTKKDPWAELINGAERTIATLQAERDAVGLSAEATAQLKYQTDLLNQAKQKNIDLSPKQRETLMGLANDMAALEVATKNAKDQLEFSKDMFKGFVNDLADGLKNGEGFWKSFGNAAMNVLDKIVDKLLNDVIDALFEVNKAGTGSGGTSLIGSLLGGITSLFSAKGNAFGDGGKVSSFATGGSFTNSVVSRSTPFKFANGTALGEMGEAGPEGILPLTRMGNGDLGVSANLGNAGASNNNQPVPVNITVKVEGANGDAHVVELVQQGVTQGLQTFNDHVLPTRVNEIANDSRVR